MSSDAKRRANQKYRDKVIIKQSVDLNKNTDRDIIKYLDSTGNKMGAIKKAIRSQMKSKDSLAKSANKKASNKSSKKKTTAKSSKKSKK